MKLIDISATFFSHIWILYGFLQKKILDHYYIFSVRILFCWLVGFGTLDFLEYQQY